MVSKTTKADAPAVATPAATAEIDRSIPSDIANTTYVLGAKPYNPRAVHNSYQWERMAELLAKAGDKGVPGPVLAKNLAQHHTLDKTHFNFISYLTRRGSLATK